MKNKKIIIEQETATDETTGSSSPADKQQADKFENFKNTMAKLYQASRQMKSTPTMPTKATKSTLPSKPSQTTQTTKATQTTANAKTPLAVGAPPNLKNQVQQSVGQPASTSGFVELENDITDGVVQFLSQKLNVDGKAVKKLVMTRGVRILVDPKYLQVK